jgi:DNA-binding NarL/FixJ family response regulator
VVAASHAAVRRRIAEGLRRASGIALLDEARDRAELERSLSECNPSIVVLVDPLRGCVELEGLGTIRTLSPTSRTIVMAEAPADAAAVVALKQGARGYCALTTDPAVLGKAIQLVQQGEIWVGRKIVPRLLDELMSLHTVRPETLDVELRRLTRREQQISELIAIGISNKEVADKLSITERTVKAHLTHIFRKLGLSSRVQLAVQALRPTPLVTTKVR